MAASAVRIRTWLPAGRIVQGSPTNRQDKDYKGNVKDKPSWYLAIAVPKTHPEINGILGQIFNVAASGYQQNSVVMQQINSGLNAPNFAWKIEDGDDPKNVQKEGFAGAWIFKLSTTLGVISCCDVNNQPIDPATVKCGYFVDATISVDINGMQDNTAGIYINPDCVRLLGYGQEISSGPSPAQLFQGRAAQIPTGASAAPVSPGHAPGGQPMQQMHGFGGQPQPMQPQPMQPQPMQPQPMQPQPMQGQPMQGQPMQGQGFGAQPMQGQGFGGQPQPMQGFTGGQPPVHVNAQGAPVGGMVQNAPSGAPAGFQGQTAYPSNPYPGGTQH